METRVETERTVLRKIKQGVYKHTQIVHGRGGKELAGHRAAILNERRTNVGAGVYVNRAGGLHWQMYFYGDDLGKLRDSGFDVP